MNRCGSKPGIVVTVSNGKGVLARVAAALAAAEADIVHVDMGRRSAQNDAELRSSWPYATAPICRPHCATSNRTASVLSASAEVASPSV